MSKVTCIKPKVLVAMSGGIDSSVAAVLLKEQGYDLIGVHLKFWHEDEEETGNQNKCCTVESADQARAVADQLGFPFYVLNFKKDFKEKVVDYFIKSSEHETPNPCVRCNREIKFGKLIQKMKELDCDFMATGHYAKVVKKNGAYHLYKGIDPEKDQSYFIHTLTQEKLQHVLLPLGDYTKTQVKEIAKKYKLSVIEKPAKESMDLCFCPEKKPHEFLKRHLGKMKPGPIKDSCGQAFTEQHEGLPLYTIGQRKGIKIGGLSDPLYVVKLDFENNTLVVGMDEELYTNKLQLRDLSFVSGEIPEKEIEVEAKIRYRSETVLGKLKIINNSSPPGGDGFGGRGEVTFQHKVRAVTPGQSVVFYKGDEVLGGGIIAN
ncbi:MAG: tRNA 2-thiouridine(34) synthase MnmA [Candidatus Gracilibacteria bacterium]|nr:tRNA 2-thiouridine(34) synthase MnmA [Candidatus Gracilibacteria bacterium]